MKLSDFRINRHYWLNTIDRRIIKKGKIVGKVDRKSFDEIWRKQSNKTMFVHVGLGAIKDAFGVDPYRLLLETFDNNDIIALAPGFTPSFRTSGVYHKLFSQPEYGTFSRLFLKDAKYRTDDAIHSILVRGEYDFSKCEHQESFSSRSCFARLDEDNILYVNIGTDRLVCVQLHFIEHYCQVPYMDIVKHNGVIFKNETEYRHITQTNFRYKTRITWNRKKIRKLMLKEGILQEYDLNGLEVRIFHAQDLRKLIAAQLERDPFYLVT